MAQSPGTTTGTPGASRESGSAIEWSSQCWGELGGAHLRNAPFPDDSRTTGIEKGGEVFPYLGHYDDNSVAFAIPRRFRPAASLDVVIICHGHRNECRRFITENRIGEILDSSGRNAILIAPQGPKNAPDSGGGKFEKAGGFAAFMDEAVAALRRSGRIPDGAQLGNVVLCGYSGGGRPVATTLDCGGLTEKISEVWLVDAAYQMQDKLAAPFAAEGSKQVLRSVFTSPLARENLLIMACISRGVRRVAVADDELTSRPGEIAEMLKREPILFVRTALPHDAFKLSEKYLGELLTHSPSLSPGGDRGTE